MLFSAYPFFPINLIYIYIMPDQNQGIFAGFRYQKPAEGYAYILFYMQARRRNSFSPRFIVNNSHSNYNNLTERQESRESQDLSARTQSELYQLSSTNCSEMDIERQLRQIKEELRLINKRLDKLEAGQEKIVERVQQLQEAFGQRRVQDRQAGEERLFPASKKLEMILTRQHDFLAKARQLARSIKAFIQSGQTTLQMVSFFLFFRISRGYTYLIDEMLFTFIRQEFIGGVSRSKILELKRTVTGRMCFNMVNYARYNFRNFREGSHNRYQTYNFEQWIEILEEEVGINLELGYAHRENFQNIILFVLSDAHLLGLCSHVNNFTEIMCMVKHHYFDLDISQSTIAHLLGLNEEEYGIVGEIIQVLNKEMI